MTTRLTKPVKRVAYAPKWGDLVVTIAHEGVTIREKGRRTSYGPVPWGKVLLEGARMKEAERRAERAARRKGKRGKR